jgi:hypothetical protein
MSLVVADLALHDIYRPRHLLVRPDHHIASRSGSDATVYVDEHVIAHAVGFSRS